MTHDPGKGRLAIEITPEEQTRYGAYRLVHTVSDDEWAVVEYSDSHDDLAAILEFMERRRQMKPELREAEARVLLKVLGVEGEDLR